MNEQFWPAVVGGLMMALAVGYVPAQLSSLILFRGKWRVLAAVPLFGMIPLVVISAKAFKAGSNLAPLPFIFGSPFAAAYLVAIYFFQRRRSRA